MIQATESLSTNGRRSFLANWRESSFLKDVFRRTMLGGSFNPLAMKPMSLLLTSITVLKYRELAEGFSTSSSWRLDIMRLKQRANISVDEDVALLGIDRVLRTVVGDVTVFTLDWEQAPARE